mgnify:CR=1 FL=1|jgi:hypothetical protein
MQEAIVQAIENGIFKWRSIPAVSEGELKIALDLLVEKRVIYENPKHPRNFALIKKETEK